MQNVLFLEYSFAHCRDGVEGGKWEGGDDDGDDRNDKRGWNDETAAAAGYPHLDIILFKR